jgi:hypothetical protein
VPDTIAPPRPQRKSSPPISTFDLNVACQAGARAVAASKALAKLAGMAPGDPGGDPPSPSMPDPAVSSARRLARIGLCNRGAIRRYVLAVAMKTGRGRVVTHVGASVYSDCERVIREHLAGLVHRHPSGFRTLEAK